MHLVVVAAEDFRYRYLLIGGLKANPPVFEIWIFHILSSEWNIYACFLGLHVVSLVHLALEAPARSTSKSI